VWGAVGDETKVESVVPVQLANVTGAIAVTARFALLGDGTERGWGNGTTGLLGSPWMASQMAARLIAHASDMDGDGMADAWEFQAFGNLTHTGVTDTDGDGLTDVMEFQRGTDPARADADGDRLTDPVDGRPASFDAGAVLAIVGGNNQSGLAGQFNPQPFDAAVWNATGTAPLVDVPMLFTVTQGGGALAATNAGSPALFTSGTVRSDADGAARLYYRQPAAAGVTSQVAVSTPTAGPVLFSTQSTSPNSLDADGDGLPDAWELQYFGGLAQNAAGDPDGDGVSNLQEYLLGRNPAKPALADLSGAVNLRLAAPSR